MRVLHTRAFRYCYIVHSQNYVFDACSCTSMLQLQPVMAWRLADDEELWKGFEWWSDIGRVVVFGGGVNRSSGSNAIGRGGSIYDKLVVFNPNAILGLLAFLLSTPPPPQSQPHFSSSLPFLNIAAYPLISPYSASSSSSSSSSSSPDHDSDLSSPPSPWTFLTQKYSFFNSPLAPTRK